jgi:hypothetical protein
MQRPPVQSELNLAKRARLYRRITLGVFAAIWLLTGLFMRAESSGLWSYLWIVAPLLIVFGIIVGFPLWGLWCKHRKTHNADGTRPV